MTQTHPINPFLKQVLELGPTLAFFVLYLKIKDETYQFAGVEYSGFIVATIVFVPLLLISMGILWALTKELSRMQIFTAFMVIVFGGLTAWFNDERFFKIKTTIVYSFFALILIIGLLQRKSYLEWVMKEALPMEHDGWMILTRRLTVVFICLAIANEIVWRTMSTDAWVKIETFLFPAALIVFLWSQMYFLRQYLHFEE